MKDTGKTPDFGLLLDLDGVLYNAEELIAGAVETTNWLCAAGIPHLFVTNTTSRPRAVLASKLTGFDIQASEAELLTPAVAASHWLQNQSATDVALFVRPATRQDFSGIHLIPDDAEHGASYVVIGDLGRDWDYATLNRAFRLLHHNPQAKLIALGMTRYWKAPDGISLDVAPFVAALEHATGRSALVFGKPAANFFAAAAQILNLPPKRVLMIGDDIQTDVRGAQLAGMRGALVQTGKFQAADLAGDVKPEIVMSSIADLPRLWPEIADILGGAVS